MLQPRLEAVEVEVYHRRGEESQHLADDQASDDGDAQRPAKFRASSSADSQRHRTQHRRHGGHHNRTKTKQAGLVNGFQRGPSLAALGLNREINHQNRVLLNDANQKNDANHGDDAKFRLENEEGQQCADARRRKRGENCDGMNVAFVEDAENDVYGSESRENQNRLRRQRGLKGLRGSLKAAMNIFRHADLALGGVDIRDRRAESGAWSKVERESDGRELSLMIDGERSPRRLVTGQGAERNQFAFVRRDKNGFQGVRILLVLRSYIEHNVILVQAFVHIRDLALAERVVERAINRRHGNAEARSSIAVDDK